MLIAMIRMFLNETSKLYECDDCSECPQTTMYELQFKTNKKIMKDYNWEYFKAQLIKAFRTNNKTNYSQRKIDVF